MRSPQTSLFVFTPNRQGVYTPASGRCLPCHSMNYACTGSPWVVTPGTGQDFGRRPQRSDRHPEGSLQAKRTSVPAPKAHADAGKAMHAAKDPVW